MLAGLAMYIPNASLVLRVASNRSFVCVFYLSTFADCINMVLEIELIVVTIGFHLVAIP